MLPQITRNDIIWLIATALLVLLVYSISLKAPSMDLNDPEGNQMQDTAEISVAEVLQDIEVVSSLDSQLQHALFIPAFGDSLRPLLLSLHSWSGDYTQKDTLSALALEKNWTYLHPDFRGPNRTKDACCSEEVLADLDDAIDYAFQHASVDSSQVYVVGGSGGGYATLCMFMHSRHRIRHFSAWVPISDLVAWYEESRIRKTKYAEEILQCTSNSTDSLDHRLARQKSPFYAETPVQKLADARLEIFAGVLDGIQGSVPITQSINFYNKIARDIGADQPENLVSDTEIRQLLEHRKPLDSLGQIGKRDICLEKQTGNLRLVIFQGGHEMLPEYVVESIVWNGGR